jgi:pimeloyl-ACP methyl ester carboxylesterase
MRFCQWVIVLGCLASSSRAQTVDVEALTPCRVSGIAHAVQCGVVHRPLNGSDARSARIDVHYVVVPALARRKLADPVFFLAGGPGQSAISLAPQVAALFSRLSNRRDLVFVDQRGTGKSAPLQCADSKHQALADQATQAQQVAQLVACKADLLKLPYIRSENDLAHFTTPLAMQDLDAVRQQLGVERINLVGVSYGTRAALDYLRQFPAHVRRTVLDAVAPPDMALPASFSTDGQAALQALLTACDAEAACTQAHPQLRRQWAELLQSLPRSVSSTHPLTGQVERFSLTREMLLGTVRGALYNPAVAAALPAAISATAQNRFDGLLGLGAMLKGKRGAQIAMGMHFSVVCAEDLPRLSTNTDAPGADFGTSGADLYKNACAHWPRDVVPASFYAVLPTRAPTLLFSGALDPATPPRHGVRMAQALGPAAQHVVVPGAGHGVMSVGCAPDVIYHFIHDDDTQVPPAAVLKTACLNNVPRPGAFQPIQPASGSQSKENAS